MKDKLIVAAFRMFVMLSVAFLVMDYAPFVAYAIGCLACQAACLWEDLLKTRQPDGAR